MTINIGEILPNSSLTRFSSKGLENLRLHDFINNDKVIIFGVPGAYSRYMTFMFEHEFYRARCSQ